VKLSPKIYASGSGMSKPNAAAFPAVHTTYYGYEVF